MGKTGRRRGERLNTGRKNGVGEFLESRSSWPSLLSELVSYLFMKRSPSVYPEVYGRDGKKIFRRIVMEIRYTGVTLSFADFSPNLNASFALCSRFDLSLSLSLSFVKNNFISPLRLFSSFFVSSSFVQFISLRSNEAATEMGGKEMGGKLWIFWLEERDRSQY